ncbi:MAG: hypothetical protein PW845_06515 [Pseudomonas sp.]|uniref:hypothetical protein n=1 Tax=Pseudomonas abieticivorans TaxID=2931382 RepID=UPI0020C1851E|nr:hypothetical protein [Pseudomonas sp. PIA16]MDE1165039.1 hypothetical protein [Pseudomonas sp.]
MTALWSWLFSTPRTRYFVRLDAKGHCQAFKQCLHMPTGGHWVETDEIRLGWLDRPLPLQALIHVPCRGARIHHALPS